jgi:hypothetical protein
LVAAFGVSGCGTDPAPAPAPSSPTSAAGVAPPSAATPLPPPDALTGVLAQLADTSIPAEQKLPLVQFSSPEDVAALGNFGQALRDGGFTSPTFFATDVAWAGTPGDVTATVTIGTANDAGKTFTYPMEFVPVHGTWQLSRKTADQLLQLGSTPTPTPPVAPTPTPTP